MPALPSAFDIQAVQKLRKAAVLVLGLALIGATLFLQSPGGVEGDWHEAVEAAGLGAIVIAIVGRAWCSLYIGGRKKAEIVDRGPYSISRNPLYVFSFIGAFGIGAQTGQITVAAIFVVAAWVIFRATVRKEEAWLSREFGETYAAYVRRTPRFLPRFSAWRDDEERVVRPAFFLLTLRDGLAFLIAIPLFEAIDAAQAEGWLRVLTHLP
ncbi:MAG: isoprenylcysteine carboxylmethyltransferase family protein [Brevundimonas sp.]|uniref:methyltransferase family protein n=1 Tax=Brevundimonas sp. TaxID=1871086 RepID=UPI0025BE9300|nr:isoprenylcysteine carboxylmethyltransferase family protein [Brevundimonas sp.]MBX3476092.1 isoprenylcysteine carboxylmethyltransferase family protein [Brevundimonas sp.]